MKKIVISIIVLLIAILLPLRSFNQVPPPPPDPGQGPCNTGGTPVGGPSAPIGDGALVLVLLAASYGMKKSVFNNREEQNN